MGSTGVGAGREGACLRCRAQQEWAAQPLQVLCVACAAHRSLLLADALDTRTSSRRLAARSALPHLQVLALQGLT